MAQLDKTGPEGRGARTGRQLGHCSNTAQQDQLEQMGKGRGLRRRSGGGIGRGKRCKNLLG